jgi:indole-3-glycerol phosphate synthase
MADILQKIADHKREEVARLKAALPLEQVRERTDTVLPNGRFKEALAMPNRVNIIAELKKGSPSRGVLDANFNVRERAQAYRDGGAAALSVLTDEKFFFGSFDNLTVARKTSGLPILCKDFILDPYQALYARMRGADAILLIVTLLGKSELVELLACAKEAGMDVLVEVHNEAELDVALEAQADLVGVNSRNLADFSVDLANAERLAPNIPEGVIKVAESGIFTSADIVRLKKADYSCFLVGEALMTAPDPANLLRVMNNA